MADDAASKPEHTHLFRPPAAAEAFTGVVRLDWSDLRGPQSAVIEGRVVIGSSPHADVVVDDPTVSRLHAELTPGERGFWVRDLQSKNGTSLQGVQIERGLATHLARLQLGQTVVVVTHSPTRPKATPELGWPEASFGGLLGGSSVMRALYTTLARVAASPAPVLVGGETGTGKEVVARALHDASPRAGKPFVVVDCAALPESLLDAELFGHARGAYTGAASAREGALESADGGTVFLDEIGELPRGMQPKLLRVLEAKTVRRIGENHHRPIDVRFVSATHRDLLAMVSAGDFREDLYFRLSVLCVTVPPLRDHLDDVATLARHFLGPHGDLERPLLDELRARSWPGNVRELRNFIDRIAALGFEGAMAMSGERPAPRFEPSVGAEPAIDAAIPLREFRDAWLIRGERAYVSQLLEDHAHNVTLAAKAAGVDRTYLYKLIRKYQIERESR